ncbi:UPF0348 protein YlbM [Sporosarcina sp. NCCP-2716]|uniref:nucleotidyltransferase n=1 Tax=Sporosarcina sp. NCCP-2716 TaxID=2943679 RepID=UPI002040A3E8|nr:nucleotidyltransferase [Sporosarcina sp. NCCP-2716]GKV67700.1 UPF0348 protein YlbM [Sporosarcina sp. NCCP-2716]
MKAVGIVAEYNPFHNGHRYQAEQAKLESGADAVVAVMSGDFLQRGEPALVDKWTRTRMALANGVDLVIELPYANATANAPAFSEGAIRLLDAAGCSGFCFGSENGSIGPFRETMERLRAVRPKYEEAVRAAVRTGISYPKALNEAYESLVRKHQDETSTVDLSKPNNILGFHYMEAAAAIGSAMTPFTVQRLGAGYYDDISVHSRIASATGIRKEIFSRPAAGSPLESIRPFVPDATYGALSTWLGSRNHFGSWERFYPQLRFQILRSGPVELARIADVAEGLENAFFKAAKTSGDFPSFMARVKSKRYTWTRLQRMLTHIYTGVTKDMRDEAAAPDHLRILGATPAGRRYLKLHKEDMTLPAVSRLASHDSAAARLSARVSDSYAFGIDPLEPLIGLDYRTPPIMEG